MYLEACAMLPQIYMFQRQTSQQGGVVEVPALRALNDVFLTSSLTSEHIVLEKLILICAAFIKVSALHFLS